MRTWQLADKVRSNKPRILHIANTVAAAFSDAGLRALGARSWLSVNEAEIEELVTLSQALVINLGSLQGKALSTMLNAGKAANRAGIPVVLDPVGVGAISARRQQVKILLQEIRFSLIRGNAGELAQLAGITWRAKGVDAGSGTADLFHITQEVARRYGCVALLSGATDIIADENHLVTLQNGSAMFPKVTASGCLFSAVCAAFLAVSDGRYFSACVEACAVYIVAGELAAQDLQPSQYGEFSLALLDRLASIDSAQVAQKLNITIIQE
ncbi:hydroxyethylthiazole kinase [Caviibacterium pharyngocola]|uniref:Hydroxyethylthiazole kinase n=1 Tax=Caviibacterium pharyngocola TaxID=28159 RepID=A0A2M8RSP2_9PAST|nr:hydroxyethylthiazole kinase [Caviibacterium pharyngocola]PJG81904.1 hydroxyethylthiazole kinase [Caviibacterium pharyngocola]